MNESLTRMIIDLLKERLRPEHPGQFLYCAVCKQWKLIHSSKMKCYSCIIDEIFIEVK